MTNIPAKPIPVKERVLDLANKISRTKRGTSSEIKPEHPEYSILEPVVTEEMAEVALCLELRVPQSAAQVAARCGKPVERTSQLLWDLAMAGVCFVNKIDGVDQYWHEIWVPGHMEMMVNNKENVKKFPQIGKAFDDYGKLRGPKAAGIVPVGSGPMRVIPIQRSIDGETRRASYEEVSTYLNENDLFSVSDCSCRTARESIGEGCGHVKDDMCIQLGHAAEYYIRTGRGRAITRDEAFAIIQKAEENGLMHNIPNTDGPGKTHAICNCCGCGCFAVRIANLFVNPDMVRSNYISQVDKDKCVGCGECVEACPTNALKLGQKICAKTPAPLAPRRDLPHDTEWGPDKWNVDYRTNRQVVVETGSSPCKAECPAHIGIQGYIKLASQGRYREALELIKTENPFPAVCGRVCPRYCESACTRGEVDDPIAIDEIKKFLAEQDLKAETRFVPQVRHQYGNRIAVVGAGPSGLACAYFLAVDGYKVTVFEKQPVLGGMLTLGIPAFRLEKDVVSAEIEVLRELGVEFRTGVEVGKDVTVGELRSQGFEAFYLAIGAQLGRKLGIEGEAAEGVMTGVDFLRQVNLGEGLSLDGPSAVLNGQTVVIGGGNVAIDVARTAVRAGASSVAMVCLEGRAQMPALPEEIEEALAEGIQINNSWGPRRILVEGGRVVGVEFQKCLSVFDENKRFSPKFDENETLVIPARHVLVSVGQAMDWGNLVAGTRVEFNPNKTVKADRTTYQTAESDIFAGGDAVTGPRFAIDAIAMGKEAAISIHRHVHPNHSLVLGRTKRDYKSLDKQNLDLGGYDHLPRQAVPHVDGAQSKATFHDLRTTLTADQVKQETERCLGCGATVSDEFLCIGCGVCTTKCRFDAIHLVRRYDKQNPEFKDMKAGIVKHALKRQVRIAVKNVTRPLGALFTPKAKEVRGGGRDA